MGRRAARRSHWLEGCPGEGRWPCPAALGPAPAQGRLRRRGRRRCPSAAMARGGGRGRRTGPRAPPATVSGAACLARGGRAARAEPSWRGGGGRAQGLPSGTGPGVGPPGGTGGGCRRWGVPGGTGPWGRWAPPGGTWRECRRRGPLGGTGPGGAGSHRGAEGTEPPRDAGVPVVARGAGARGMPQGCERPEGPQGAGAWGCLGVQGAWGRSRGAEGPGAPFAGPYLDAASVRGVPGGAPCPGPAWPVGSTPPHPGSLQCLPGGARGGLCCGEMPRTEGFPWYFAACTPQPGTAPPRAVFCAQNSLHFALLISALAETLCLTLWGEPRRLCLVAAGSCHLETISKCGTRMGSHRRQAGIGGFSCSCNTWGGFSLSMWRDARAQRGQNVATRRVRAASPCCSGGGLLQRLAWQRVYNCGV